MDKKAPTGAAGQTYGTLARSGFVWGLAGRWASELISVPTAMILARLLAPREFGVAAAAAFFVQIGTSLTSFGFNQALVRRQELHSKHTSTVFWINLLACSAVWLLLMLFAPALGVVFRSEDAAQVIPWAAATIVIGSFSSIPAVILSREMRYPTIAKLEVGATVINSTVSITLALAGFGLWSLIYPPLAAFTFQAVARTLLTGWRPTLEFSREALNEVLSFGVGLHAKRLLDTGALNIDNLVVGRALGMSALGFYDKAFSTMNRVVSALSTVGPSVSFRIFSLIHEDHERFRRAYRKVVLTSTLMAYPALAGLAAAAEPVILTMFGERWASAAMPFRMLCLAGMLKMQNAYASTAIQSKGQVWGEVARQVLYLALIVTGAWAGSHWGLTGAATGVVAATVIMWLLMHELLRRVATLGWRDLLVPQCPALLCGAAVASLVLVAGWAVKQAVPGAHPLGVLAAQGVTGGAFYVAFVVAVPAGEVREVVDDTLVQFAPRLASRLGRGPSLAVRQK